LFEALAALAPRGPILASVIAELPARGRASELGARLGRALGPAPHAYPPASTRVCCTPHAGFLYAFDRSRLEQLARCAARTLQLDEAAGVPHAAFR